MNMKVLINDDDPVCVFLHKTYVINGGWDNSPLLFTNPHAVLTHLADDKHREQAYLLLLDINMPEMSGWELLDRLTANGWDFIYVIIVSSSVNKKDYARSLSYKQVVGYAEKPLSLERLRELLAQDVIKGFFKK
jgi:CheY-like chemotaxis protein